MKRTDIRNLLGKQVLFFDGGTGSVLQAQGLKPGELPETWNLSEREKIVALHYGYYRAGCNIVKTNTFGANRLKFSAPGELESVVLAALENAAEARRRIENEPIPEAELETLRAASLAPASVNPAELPHFIALDVGPAGKLLEPLGDLPFSGAVELFSDTIRAALSSARREAVDLILIETMNDCYEAKAAVVAAKETCAALNVRLPIIVTTVYDESAKLLTGADPETMTAVLEGLGVDAFGMNCSLGPHQMQPILDRLSAAASIPLAVNPNAGLPRSENGRTVYDVTPAEFARVTAGFVDRGAALVGGCCGTTSEHICRLVNACAGKPCPVRRDTGVTLISSYTKTVAFGKKPILVGERINPTGKKRFKQALREHDIQYIIREGLAQEEKGAHVLDVNVGLPEIDETELLVTVVTELQSVTDLPLQLDTSDPAAMEAALRVYNGKALVNSVNGKREVMDAVFPLVKKYGGAVVALTLDEDGIPETAEGRLRIVRKIYAAAAEYGIARKDIVIDPLAMAVSSDPGAAAVTLETLRAVRDEFGGRSILGVSNVSFGLPQRELITASFFTMAMQNGLSAAIMNPNSAEMMKAYACFCALSGYDPHCSDYIAFAESYGAAPPPLSAGGAQSAAAVHRVPATAAAQSAPATAAGSGSVQSAPPQTLEYAVIRGLKEDAAARTRTLLGTTEALDIINNHLIPALDVVGKGFEAKKVYLPQLLMSAEAAKAAFSVIKETLAAAGKTDESKGTVVLATVKGDIHDIGKNIVKVLLENYGFTVVDLGKDVPPERIADVCTEKRVRLAGLSALMTTTVPAMEATITLLRARAPWCKVCVGGAVLTPEYADMIGADFYGKDALETVKYAQSVFS